MNETPLERLMREYAREADAPGALTSALVALAVHQEILEAKLAALRAEHSPPAHFPEDTVSRRIDEIAEDKSKVAWR